MQVLGTGQPPEAPPALRTHRRTVCLSWLSAEEGRQAVWMVEAVAVYPVRVTRRPGEGQDDGSSLDEAELEMSAEVDAPSPACGAGSSVRR